MSNQPDGAMQAAIEIHRYFEGSRECVDEFALNELAEIIRKKTALAELLKALAWYADSPPRGEFTIVDDKREFISDMADWGDRAREALDKHKGGDCRITLHG